MNQDSWQRKDGHWLNGPASKCEGIRVNKVVKSLSLVHGSPVHRNLKLSQGSYPAETGVPPIQWGPTGTWGLLHLPEFFASAFQICDALCLFSYSRIYLVGYELSTYMSYRVTNEASYLYAAGIAIDQRASSMDGWLINVDQYYFVNLGLI